MSWRLFSYVVSYDAGTAPNVSDGFCSLAICKPSIRRVAEKGHWILGLAPASGQGRVVYCMQVDAKVTWKQYIEACTGTGHIEGFDHAGLRRRVPRDKNSLGDCIWKDIGGEHDPLPSFSGHERDSYVQDVKNGVNVLLSRTFWYFGSESRLQLPLDLYESLRPGRGHRSTANEPSKEQFREWFHGQLVEKACHFSGVYGKPEIRLETVESERRSCRQAEIEDDDHDEELVPQSSQQSPSGCGGR
jgi:hypothetical protein